MRMTNEVIGGRAALDAAVERFHERVSAAPELAGYFEGMDMRRILARQMTLFALLPQKQRNVRARRNSSIALRLPPPAKAHPGYIIGEPGDMAKPVTGSR